MFRVNREYPRRAENTKGMATWLHYRVSQGDMLCRSWWSRNSPPDFKEPKPIERWGFTGGFAMGRQSARRPRQPMAGVPTPLYFPGCAHAPRPALSSRAGLRLSSTTALSTGGAEGLFSSTFNTFLVFYEESVNACRCWWQRRADVSAGHSLRSLMRRHSLVFRVWYWRSFDGREFVQTVPAGVSKTLARTARAGAQLVFKRDACTKRDPRGTQHIGENFTCRRLLGSSPELFTQDRHTFILNVLIFFSWKSTEWAELFNIQSFL